MITLLKQLLWFPVVYEVKLILATTYHACSVQQPSDLVTLLHLSDISRTLRLSVSLKLISILAHLLSL